MDEITDDGMDTIPQEICLNCIAHGANIYGASRLRKQVKFRKECETDI